MTELNIPFDELLRDAFVACGEIDSETIDLLKAMFSDEADLNRDVCSTGKVLGSELCEEVHGNHPENSLLYFIRKEMLSMQRKTLDEIEKSFRDVIVDCYVRYTLQPGVVEDVLFELRYPEISQQMPDFSLYDEVWRDQFARYQMVNRYDICNNYTTKLTKDSMRVSHASLINTVWIKTDSKAPSVDIDVVMIKSIEEDGAIISIKSVCPMSHDSHMTNGIVSNVETCVLSMISKQIEN